MRKVFTVNLFMANLFFQRSPAFRQRCCQFLVEWFMRLAILERLNKKRIIKEKKSIFEGTFDCLLVFFHLM